jgi:transposase
MVRKNYSEEFRRQAVDLYESSPGATVRRIAADLGVERGTLRHWLDLYGTGRKTAADGTATRSPLGPGRADLPVRGTVGPVPDETAEQELARLRARVAELEATERKLTTEREILRSAAKYFAGETRW